MLRRAMGAGIALGLARLSLNGTITGDEFCGEADILLALGVLLPKPDFELSGIPIYNIILY